MNIRALKIGIVQCLLAWPLLGWAGPLMIEYPHSANPSTVDTRFDSELLRGYQFVAKRIPDLVDREQCPIRILFKDLRGFTGFTPTSQLQTPCADRIEIDLSLFGSWKAQIVLVHELTHLFRNQHNAHEERWLQEGLAKLMEVLYVGIWSEAFQRQILQMHSFVLTNDEEAYNPEGLGYVTAYFLLHFLYNRLGEEAFLREVMSARSSGWHNIEEAARKMRARKMTNIPEQFLLRDSLWTNFGLALLINDPDIAVYGLSLIDYRFQSVRSLRKTHPLPTCSAIGAPRAPWSIQYCDPVGDAHAIETLDHVANYVVGRASDGSTFAQSLAIWKDRTKGNYDQQGPMLMSICGDCLP